MIQIDLAAQRTDEATVLYQNLLTMGTFWASSETTDGAGANALGPQTYDFWRPAVLPASIGVDLPSAMVADAAAIVGHTLGSSGATAYIDHWDGSAWVLDAAVTPETDEDILLIFRGSIGTRWRINIAGSTPPAISVVMIGPRFYFPGGVAPSYTPINLAVTVDLMSSSTITGHYIGTRVKRKGAGTSITLGWHDREWIESAEAKAFIAYFNDGQPFIWASDPELLADDMAYCWRSGGVLSASYESRATHGTFSAMEVTAYVGN